MKENESLNKITKEKSSGNFYKEMMVVIEALESGKTLSYAPYLVSLEKEEQGTYFFRYNSEEIIKNGGKPTDALIYLFFYPGAWKIQPSKMAESFNFFEAIDKLKSNIAVYNDNSSEFFYFISEGKLLMKRKNKIIMDITNANFTSQEVKAKWYEYKEENDDTT